MRSEAASPAQQKTNGITFREQYCFICQVWIPLLSHSQRLYCELIINSPDCPQKFSQGWTTKHKNYRLKADLFVSLRERLRRPTQRQLSMSELRLLVSLFHPSCQKTLQCVCGRRHYSDSTDQDESLWNFWCPTAVPTDFIKLGRIGKTSTENQCPWAQRLSLHLFSVPCQKSGTRW